jgi:hypothetical protein
MAIVVLAGCGGLSAPKTSAPAQTGATTQATQAASPPSIGDAESYARSLLPGYLSELRNRGADLFGKTVVQCAPTGGPELECLVRIPYRRLESCAVAKGSVFVEATPSGLQKAGGGGRLSLIRQICYIGPNGEPVPSPPASKGEPSIRKAEESESLAAYEQQLASGQIQAATIIKRIRTAHIMLRDGQHVVLKYAAHQEPQVVAQLKAKGVAVTVLGKAQAEQEIATAE